MKKNLSYSEYSALMRETERADKIATAICKAFAAAVVVLFFLTVVYLTAAPVSDFRM